MSYFTELLPAFLKSPARDQVTTLEFTSLESHPLLLLGYERGFQVWTLADITKPALILSKRTVALSVLTAVPCDPLGTLLLVHKYDSEEFPRDLIRAFSLTNRGYSGSIRCQGKVRSVLTSCKAICVLTDSGGVEVLAAETRERLYCWQISRPEAPFVVQAALSSLYFAYSLQRVEEPEEVPADEGLTGLVTRSIYSLADQSYSTVRSYLEAGSPSSEGKVQILHILSKAGICEIQAFPGPVAMLKFSPAGHLMVVAPQSGQYFHVYRINPPLTLQKAGNLVRYLLLYKLYRGFTQAVISDISFSGNEHWVCISSARGTAHIYQVDPGAGALHYNHQVHCRVKQGWFAAESVPAPRCFLPLSSPMLSRDRIRFDDPLFPRQTPMLVAVTAAGRYSTHEIASESVEIAAIDLARDIAFQEIDQIPDFPVSRKEEKHWGEPLFEAEPGWLPLMRSPQVQMMTARGSWEDFVVGKAQLEEVTAPAPLSSHVIHYSAPNSRSAHILESLQTSLTVQTVPLQVNPAFLDTENSLEQPIVSEIKKI